MQLNALGKVGRRAGRALLALSVLTTSLCLFSLGYSQATLTWLGTLGGNFSEAHAVSGDGKVVVGVARNNAGQLRAFRWTQNTGMVDLGTLGGTEAEAWGVSLDGSIVVGGARNLAGQMRPFRWENNAMTDLGTLGGANGIAWGISGDGSTIVGRAQLNNGFFHAFRWQNNTMTDLGTFGGTESLARGVSYDGSVVAGAAMLSNNEYRPFRWTQDTGLVQLPLISANDAGARNVSLDGNVLVGISSVLFEGYRAVRWIPGSSGYVLQSLGSLTRGSNTDGFSDAWGVALGGDIVVGISTNSPDPRNNRAFRWTPQQGIQNLTVVYSGLLGTSVLEHAFAISPCGRYIVGRGFNAATGRPEAFLLDTGIGDTNADGCVDDTDLLAVLFDFGATGPNRPADVNRDNIVDDADLLIVLCNFGSGC
jgi:probable HAF family extracellular repeat protein